MHNNKQQQQKQHNRKILTCSTQNTYTTNKKKTTAKICCQMKSIKLVPLIWYLKCNIILFTSPTSKGLSSSISRVCRVSWVCTCVCSCLPSYKLQPFCFMFTSTLTHNKLNENFPHMVKRRDILEFYRVWWSWWWVMNNYVYENQGAFYSALQASTLYNLQSNTNRYSRSNLYIHLYLLCAKIDVNNTRRQCRHGI